MPRGELGSADVYHNADVAELTPPLALLWRSELSPTTPCGTDFVSR